VSKERIRKAETKATVEESSSRTFFNQIRASNLRHPQWADFYCIRDKQRKTRGCESLGSAAQRWWPLASPSGCFQACEWHGCHGRINSRWVLELPVLWMASLAPGGSALPLPRAIYRSCLLILVPTVKLGYSEWSENPPRSCSCSWFLN
jgi:hypothetical protein